VDRGPRGLVGVGDGFGLDLAAVDPELAQRWSVRAEEEAADDRFADAGEAAPAVERLRDGEVFDAQPRLAPWVADDVDGGLLAVGELVAEKLVAGGKGPHRHPSSEATSLRGLRCCASGTGRGQPGEHNQPSAQARAARCASRPPLTWS
jgi:hypothetical protein